MLRDYLASLQRPTAVRSSKSQRGIEIRSARPTPFSPRSTALTYDEYGCLWSMSAMASTMTIVPGSSGFEREAAGS